MADPSRMLQPCPDAAALAAELHDLRARVERLERGRGRGPRDDADHTLLALLAAITAGRRFSAGEVQRHAAAMDDDHLRVALQDADADTAAALGSLLRRCEGFVVEGLALVRLGRDRYGRGWQFSRVTGTVTASHDRMMDSSWPNPND